MNLSKEVMKPDAEWAGELLHQIRTELERQRREQRKALQQLITDIRGLVEKMSRRTPPAESAAKRRHTGREEADARRLGRPIGDFM